MSELADNAGRLRALTDFDATLMVEAAAGTGKTALMAGRLTMMLVNGVDPGCMAAITFTELAASELAARVHEYVDELLTGGIPAPLSIALPGGLGREQRTRLGEAASRLDTLTASTIHGFCQEIIRQYSVEADIDPGAAVMDAEAAETAFAGVFDRWFRRRLGGGATPGDPIVTLSRDNPRQVAATLRQLARFRLEHRTARAPAADFSPRPDIDFAHAVAEFRRWVGRNPQDPPTNDLVTALEGLVAFFAGALDGNPSFGRLWELAHPPRIAAMRRDSFHLVAPRRMSAWKKHAGKEEGAWLARESAGCFAAADVAYRSLLGSVATALVSILATELDEVLQEYAAFKRAAAVLDFDDLLHRAAAMLRAHEPVRAALGLRYRHIFVDEFQDTDPLQAEILFRIASSEPTARWQDGAVREGSLFLVGDPKQAIYQFRGANAGSYGEARAIIARRWPDNIIQITANFRSRGGILDHVNQFFAGPLSAPGQPGYMALMRTVVGEGSGLPAVMRLPVDLPPDTRAEAIREAEAEAVAEACVRLIGNRLVRGSKGVLTELRPGGIALLAPTGTGLWLYERAFEEHGLRIASQAGKGLFRRQETQDLVALTRVLADGRDTLAFGALMRGPLVGLSDEELMDIAMALPNRGDPPEPAVFSVRTDPEHIAHPVARDRLSVLRDLRHRARSTTPALVLVEAIERLGVRPALAARGAGRSARAAANVEAFLERATQYAARGLRRFARDVSQEWSTGASAVEGRVDSDGDAVEIVTIHSSKGLEWPVVIPINTATQLRGREEFVHRASDDTLHWLVGDVVPPGLGVALAADDADKQRERERLWYVACTRARDLLIIPDVSAADARSWARVVELGRATVPALDVTKLRGVPVVAKTDAPNNQDAAQFERERATILRASPPIEWHQPSRTDPDRLPLAEITVPDATDAIDMALPIGAGRVRGLLLHKLIEEVLSGECREDPVSLASRGRALLTELAPEGAAAEALPDVREIAATVIRTLALPAIAALRPRLMPELPLYAFETAKPASLALAGRADAVEVADGRARTVIDWKSDVSPGDAERIRHREQLREYVNATGAAAGLVVYMTSGSVIRIEA